MVEPIHIFNDSASPKMVTRIYFNFFRFFLKVLELFECRRGDQYILLIGTQFACLTRKKTI